MRARRLWFGLLGTLALATVPVPAGAQAVGEEFQVDTYTTSHQRRGHLVGILGQRPDSGGGVLGDEKHQQNTEVDR